MGGQQPCGGEILVVDDDGEVREMVAEYLRDSGYSVQEASCGSEALDVLRANCALRLLISDIRMPGMDGVELADHAAAQRGDLKIILMSGYFVQQRVQRTFLVKPFRMAELMSAVRSELCGRARGT